MIPVKSISQLSSLQDQKESLIPFEQFVVDSNEIGVCRYGISATNTAQGLYAGELSDGQMYIEVSYDEDGKGKYVPRKFDFSNYLRYIENALSILNNGIMGVYLTKDQADELYVKIAGDKMTGPLRFDLNNNDDNQFPAILIEDHRVGDSTTQGYIKIVGDDNAGIKIGTKDAQDKILLSYSSGSTLTLDSVLTANSTNIQLGKPLQTSQNVTFTNTLTATSSTLTLDHVQINSELSSTGGIKVTSGNIDVAGSGNIKTASGNIQGSTLTATTELKGPKLTITNAITADATNITIASNTTIGSSSASKNLTVYGNIQGSTLTATTELKGPKLTITDIITADATNGIALKKNTTLGTSGSAAADFTISNGNIIMTSTAQIQFGTGSSSSSISYSTSDSAFLISDLKIKNKLIVGEKTPATIPSSHEWNSEGTDANRVLTINGYAVCNSIVRSPYFVAGSKILVQHFEAENITATEMFTQEKGIANLTAKRACWA